MSLTAFGQSPLESDINRDFSPRVAEMMGFAPINSGKSAASLFELTLKPELGVHFATVIERMSSVKE